MKKILSLFAALFFLRSAHAQTTVVASPTSDEAISGTWSGSASARYTVVNDYPDASASTYLTHGLTAGNLTFGYSAFSIPSDAYSISVAVKYYDQKTTALGSAVAARLKVNGSYYNGSVHDPSNGVWTLRTDTWINNPATSASWTPTEINTLLTAFGYYASDADPTILLSSIRLEVTYYTPLLEIRETFTNNTATTTNTNGAIGWTSVLQTGSTTPASSSISWQAEAGASAVQPIATGKYAIAHANGYVRASTTANRVLFYRNTNINITRTGKELSRVIFKTANSDAASSFVFAVHISGSNWYGWGSGATQAAASGSTTSTAFATYTRTYDTTLTTSNWYLITNDGTNLSYGGTPGALPSGDVDGIGVYFVKGTTGADIRLDDISVYTTASTLPIPGAPTSLTIAGSNLTWTNNASFPNATDYQITTNAGQTWTDVAAKPVSLTSAYYDGYQIGVRVKSVMSANTYGETGWYTTSFAATNLAYQEAFPYPGTTSASSSGWNMLYNSATLNGVGNGNQNVANSQGSPDYGNYSGMWKIYQTNGFGSNSNSSVSKFFYTTYSLSIPRTTVEITKMQLQVANTGGGSTQWGVRMAVKIGTDFYVYSASPYYQTASSAGFADVVETAAFNVTGSNWYKLTVVQESSAGVGDGTLSLSGTAQALPAGNIVAVGVYFTRTSAATANAVRFDNVQIYTAVPPTTKRVPIGFLDM